MFWTLAMAFILALIPMPLGMEWLRPDWLLMALLFWTWFSEAEMSIFNVFGWGLAKDLLSRGWIGQTALSYTIIGYLALKLAKRIAIFPLHQQAASVGLLLGLHQLILLWTGTLVHKVPLHVWLYWIPSVLGVILWPWFYMLLQFYRRRRVA